MDTTVTELEQTVDGLIALYPKEWMLIRITSYDERGLVDRGILLAHHKSQRQIRPAVFAAMDRSKQTGEMLSIFYGVERLGWGPDAPAQWEATLQQYISGGDKHG